MATVADLARDIRVASKEYLTELEQSGDVWEKKPASGSGEEGWSARQVAEHVAGSCGLFGVGISRAIGLDGPGRTNGEFEDVQAAVKHMPSAINAVLASAAPVPADKLTEEFEFGPLGKTSIQRILEISAHHFRDHAGQLRALRG